MIPSGSQQPLGPGRDKRRIAKGRSTTDERGNVVVNLHETTQHRVSDQDCLDTLELDFSDYFDCGCNAKTNRLGGRCAECGGTTCEKCFAMARCACCMKPLCLRHAFSFEPGRGQARVILCATHHDEMRRRQFWRRVGRAVLSPFVAFDDPRHNP